jgi:hypothetical protein
MRFTIVVGNRVRYFCLEMNDEEWFSYASERMLFVVCFCNGFNPPLITFNNQLRTGADKGNPTV